MDLAIWGLRDVPLVRAGDDLADILGQSLERAGLQPASGDTLVVAQKIVSKAEGRTVRLAEVEPSAVAVALAKEVDKDPRLVHLILGESVEVVRKRTGVLITRHRLGHVCANAGLDQSNIDHDGGECALLLPADPDASAEELRGRLLARTGADLAVLICDSTNRPWRLGSVGAALGAAGFHIFDDRRGDPDLYGRELQATLANRADSICAAAVFVMGEADEGVPAALVRGGGAGRAAAAGAAADQTAALIQRPATEDLFR
jgi:coenzyme F420-0:L-glutamate ligase/coenzyme F420-1:gamma-L-glutamate ligase